MFKKKKKKVPTFDELKDNRFQYHYSREERLKMTNSIRSETLEPKKGLAKILGRNKTFIMLLLFYFAVGGIIWYYFYLTKMSQSIAEKRIYHFETDVTVEIRLIQSDTRHGLNLAVENKGKGAQKIETLTFRLPGFLYTTNLSILLEPEGFDAYFIPVTNSVTNLTELEFEYQ